MSVQNDEANVRFRDKMMAAITEGDPMAKFGVLPVTSGLKDISKQHKTENAAQIKADLAAFNAAQEQKTSRPVPQGPAQPVVRTPAPTSEAVKAIRSALPYSRRSASGFRLGGR